MSAERILEMFARLCQLAPMVKAHPTQIVVRERNTALVAEALVNLERLLGECYRTGWLAREVHRPAQVIQRGRDGMLVARLTEESLRLLEQQSRLHRSALHVRQHTVRQDEPRACLVVAFGTGRTEHAIDPIPSFGEEPPGPEADERLGHPDGFVGVSAVERIVQRSAKVV